METTTVALCVATLVVAVLLMSCWDSKMQMPAKSCVSEPHAVVMRGGDPDDDSNQRSDWGSGVVSRELAKQHNELATLDGYDDYAAVTQYQALDPEVFESHESYGDQIGVSNNGASALAIRSDPNDVVTWTGLRRPDYHSVFAASDARTQHSEFADQMFPATRYGGI